MKPVTCLSLQHHFASFHKTKYILKCLTTSNMGCLGCPNLSFETAVNVPKPIINLLTSGYAQASPTTSIKNGHLVTFIYFMRMQTVNMIHCLPLEILQVKKSYSFHGPEYNKNKKVSNILLTGQKNAFFIRCYFQHY